MSKTKMTKKDIAKEIAEVTGVSRRLSGCVVQLTIDFLVRSLAEHRRIELRNFGVFSVESREARKARNPQTGADVFVPPKEVVVFKPGKVLKEKVQQAKNGSKIVPPSE